MTQKFAYFVMKNVRILNRKKFYKIKRNLKHMNKNHGFFISDEKYIRDRVGLIRFLAKKINENLVCIYCSSQSNREFKTAESVKKHMLDKGHCFMNVDVFY